MAEQKQTTGEHDVVGISGVKGRWSVAEAAFLPRGGFGGGSALGGWGSFATALFETIAVAIHLEDVHVMGEPVEQGAGEPFGAEDLGPFLEGQVRGDQGRAALVALAEHLEEQLGAGLL
jgi:hypothetical protein